jgi:hypothetical protein
MSKHRILSGIGAAVSFSGLALQSYINFNRGLQEGENPYLEVAQMLGFMTIWSNILVFLVFLAATSINSNKLFLILRQPAVRAATALYIALVGLVYHLLLSHIYNPEGLGFYSNGLLHYIVPAGYFIYWVVSERKVHLPYLTSITWIAFPSIYTLFILAKGFFTQFYPYPFFDVNQWGYLSVLTNAVGLGVVYMVAGLILVALNNQLVKYEK